MVIQHSDQPSYVGWDTMGRGGFLMVEIPLHQIESIVAQFYRRAEAARNAGGISRIEVEDNLKTVPEGWKYDYSIDFWLPPNVDLL